MKTLFESWKKFLTENQIPRIYIGKTEAASKQRINFLKNFLSGLRKRQWNWFQTEEAKKDIKIATEILYVFASTEEDANGYPIGTIYGDSKTAESERQFVIMQSEKPTPPHPALKAFSSLYKQVWKAAYYEDKRVEQGRAYVKRPTNIARFDRQMRLAPKQKRNKIEQEIYDASPFNKRSIINNIVISMLDPRGPWGYSSGDLAGDYETNWDAFKSSLSDLKNAKSGYDGAKAVGMVALNALGLIPFIPSPSKAAGATVRGVAKTSRITRPQIIKNAEKASGQIRKIAKDPKLPNAKKQVIVKQADDIDVVVKIEKQNEALFTKYKSKDGKSFCIKKKVAESNSFGITLESGRMKVVSEDVGEQCFPFQFADSPNPNAPRGRAIDPIEDPKAYGLTRQQLEALHATYGAAKVVRGAKAFEAAKASTPIGVYSSADKSLVYIVMSTSNGPMPFYRSSGKSYDVMHNRFVPAGPVENWKTPSGRLQKLRNHPDIAQSGEKLADASVADGAGKYMARNSELGFIGTRLDGNTIGKPINSNGLLKKARTDPNHQMQAILSGELSNFSKYGDIGEYIVELNKKLAALDKPQIPNLAWLDDACLNKWLMGQLNVRRNMFDGDITRVRGYNSGPGGPSWADIKAADDLL
tara:strand:+ start:373 stop:2298 length:1926 start_codon:yes stop_codon:yes gene_type:complete